MAGHAQTRLAFDTDIPGPRVGPEDGPWPRAYYVLSEPDIAFELDTLALPQTFVLDPELGLKVDALNFQPCVVKGSQDRYVVEQWDIAGGLWTLTGVFDGHLGEATVEHTAIHLPVIIRSSLEKALSSRGTVPLPVDTVSDILREAILSFDEAIAGDVLALFPGGTESLSTLPDADIRSVINDHEHGLQNYQKVRLCMHGTTALVALTDPSRENLWVANLGDCQAVLASQNPAGAWSAEPLTRKLNGDNPEEIARVLQEHPGEKDCVKDNRVLGAIAPFRCIGDHPFKQPSVFTRRILYNLEPGFRDKSAWEEFLERNLTPPYISAAAEVTHRRLAPAPSPLSPSPAGPRTAPRQFLILCSDGLADLYDGVGEARAAACFVDAAVGADGAAWGPQVQVHNLALRVLRRALGGADAEAVSRLLTLQMESPWLDDVTIVVQLL